MSRSFCQFARRLWLPVSLCALLLLGCGQKGELYIPERASDGTGQEQAD